MTFFEHVTQGYLTPWTLVTNAPVSILCTDVLPDNSSSAASTFRTRDALPLLLVHVSIIQKLIGVTVGGSTPRRLDLRRTLLVGNFSFSGEEAHLLLGLVLKFSLWTVGTLFIETARVGIFAVLSNGTSQARGHTFASIPATRTVFASF